MHRFKAEESISSIYDFVWVDKKPNSRFYLIDMASKHKL